MEEKILSIHPRRLARKMAKAQLDRRGATGYNKHTDGHRLRKGIRIRMSEETFNRLQQKIADDGFLSFQEWGTVQIFRYLTDAQRGESHDATP